MPENMLSDRARSARSENLHPQTQMSCHIATFAKDPGPVVSCHVATFAKNLGINDIDICPNPRDKYAQGNSVLALRELDSGVPATAKLE